MAMRAAIYARYSSENQRPESIDDQVSSCRKLAAQRAFTVDDSLVFSDEATSGARSDRKGLAALLVASEAKRFDVVLVDDLSRLARDNYLMLSIMAELHFSGVRVVSVADGLDTGDEEAKLGVQTLHYQTSTRDAAWQTRGLSPTSGIARNHPPDRRSRILLRRLSSKV